MGQGMNPFGRLSAVFGPSRVFNRPGLISLCPTLSRSLLDIALHSVAINSAWPSARNNSPSNLDTNFYPKGLSLSVSVISPFTSLLRFFMKRTTMLKIHQEIYTIRRLSKGKS